MGAGKIKFITTAALDERKGIQHFIRYLSTRKYKDYEYHIYGDGPMKQEITNLIKEYHLVEYVYLHPSNENIHTLLPEHDVYVLLSKGESFGLGWLEAVACGLPVLVSNFDPFPELIIPEYGFMVDPLNNSEIEIAIQNILEFYTRFNTKGECHLNKYSWTGVANNFIKIFKNDFDSYLHI